MPPLEGNDVPWAELFAPLEAGFPVDQDLPVLDQAFGRAPGGCQAAQLHGVLQADKFCGNGNCFHG